MNLAQELSTISNENPIDQDLMHVYWVVTELMKYQAQRGKRSVLLSTVFPDYAYDQQEDVLGLLAKEGINIHHSFGPGHTVELSW